VTCIEGSNPSLSASSFEVAGREAGDIRIEFGPLAQLDRASDYESEGQRFKSSRARYRRGRIFQELS
jgi:hypothetical protein